MKKRLLISALLQTGLTALSLLAAHNLDRLASERGPSLSFGDALTALTSRKVLTLFLMLTAVSALAVFCMAFGRSYINYRSDMLRLAPEIESPVAEGQSQYGTARWLERGQLQKAFTVVQVDPEVNRLRRLIQAADEKRAEGQDRS